MESTMNEIATIDRDTELTEVSTPSCILLDVPVTVGFSALCEGTVAS